MSILTLALSHVDLFALFNSAQSLKTLIDATSSAKDLMDGVRKAIPVVVPLIEKVAEGFFPQVAPELRLAAGIMAAFDPNKTLWLQKSINALVPGVNIAEDGIYGPKTRDAVIKVQDALGLKTDGWAGNLTNTAIQFALNRMFGDGTGSAITVGHNLGGTITPEKPPEEAPTVDVPAPPTVPRPGAAT